MIKIDPKQKSNIAISYAGEGYATTIQNKVARIKIMAFAAARMIKEKKNLEAEHKKRSSDGLSKTKSKVMSPQT